MNSGVGKRGWSGEHCSQKIIKKCSNHFFDTLTPNTPQTPLFTHTRPPHTKVKTKQNKHIWKETKQTNNQYRLLRRFCILNSYASDKLTLKIKVNLAFVLLREAPPPIQFPWRSTKMPYIPLVKDLDNHYCILCGHFAKTIISPPRGMVGHQSYWLGGGGNHPPIWNTCKVCQYLKSPFWKSSCLYGYETCILETIFSCLIIKNKKKTKNSEIPLFGTKITIWKSFAYVLPYLLKMNNFEVRSRFMTSLRRHSLNIFYLFYLFGKRSPISILWY